MNWITNVHRFLLATSLSCLALLVGCSSQSSGGDITLASPTQRNSVVPSSRNVVNTAVNTTATPPTTNFQTGSGAIINIGTQYNESSASATPTTPVVSAQSVTQPTPLRAPVVLPAAPAASVVPDTTPQTSVNTRTKTTARSAPATVDIPQGIQPSKKQVIVQTKPGCTGKQCPSIKLERLIFTEHERFSAFVEQSLLSMAQIESNQAKNFDTLKQLSDYFWATARPRDEILLRATLKRATPKIVVVQLDSYIYSGGAHGNSTTQYLNWLPQSDIVVNLQTMIPSDNMPAFEAALKRQHARWLQTNDLAKADPNAYNKMWPFQLSENAALLEDGIAITYDPYEIGPYALGMPTLIVSYSELQGILRPELMPR
jgi:hypothetical protein